MKCDPLHGHSQGRWRFIARVNDVSELIGVILAIIGGGILLIALGIAAFIVAAAVLLWAARYLRLV